MGKPSFKLSMQTLEELPQAQRSYWGYFANPWSTWVDTRWRVPLVLGFTSGDENYSPSPTNPDLDHYLPIHQPKFGSTSDAFRLTWLGHSSLLVNVDGVRVLCDPIFSERCSPSGHIGPRRYRPSPCKVEDLPPIDAVVISHNHYDHLDVVSVSDLGNRFPQAYWFVPSGIRDFILSTVSQANTSRVKEFLWWEEQPIGDTGVKVVFTPTQHWSSRYFFDSFRTLWGSWAIIGPKHRVWFGGDTGYCDVFEKIGTHFGPFDAAAIPIGAYKPRSLFKAQHIDPWEAVRIHKDIRAKNSIGIHWGTFPLTYESFMAPKEKLAEAVKAAGLPSSEFRTIHHGQSLCSPLDSNEGPSVE